MTEMKKMRSLSARARCKCKDCALRRRIELQIDGRLDGRLGRESRVALFGVCSFLGAWFACTSHILLNVSLMGGNE